MTASRIRLADPSSRRMAHRTTALSSLRDDAGSVVPEFLRRRPALTVSLLAAVLAALALSLGGWLGADANATGPIPPVDSGSRSALVALDSDSGAAVSGAGLPLAAGSSIDVVDLVVKGGLVVILLFITLRLLGRIQSGGAATGARIQVIESRTLAPKATLHLIAIGERRLVVGLTPGRLVTLAEFGDDELAGEAPAAILGGGLAAQRAPSIPSIRSIRSLLAAARVR